MAVTPNILNFTYKKYGTVPPGVLITFPDRYIIPDFSNVPNWLDIYDITTSSAKVKINGINANSFTAGTFSYVIPITVYDAGANKTYNVGSFTVNFTLEDTILLSVTPITANFSFIIGGTAPVNKTIVVTSENSWTVAKTQGWCTLSATSGSSSGSFQIGVVTTGLTAGTYNDVVTVDDGGTPKTIAVSLTISDSSSGTDYLYVTPNLLKFGFTLGGSIPTSKTIELNASAAWSVSADESWVNLPITSGSAGPAIVEIALQNLSGLAVGEYIATLTFTVGTIIKTITIQLTIYQFNTLLLNSTDLYFADDENYISIASGRLDTFMKLSIATLYKSISYFFEASIPIFKGGAQKRMGLEAKKIIGKQDLIGFADISVSQPYPPINLDIIIDEVKFDTGIVVTTQTINNITFIKGNKPLNNWLSDLPEKVFLTNKAVLCFGILSGGVTPTSIEITGDITNSIAITAPASEFYNVVIPISSLGLFNVGDSFTITILGQSITVVIRAEEVDQTLIFWQNKNGIWDSTELVGEVIITSLYNRTTATVRKTELTQETKVIDVTIPQEYKIETGAIHTYNEVKTLDKMLRSKNIFIKTQGTLVPVYPTTTKLPVFETMRDFTSFSLTFKNTIE